MISYRKIGIKLTPQRIAILDYLEGNKDHPSAEEIYRAVSEKFPTMSFATVYNTLSALKNKGSVCELTFDTSRKRYDPDVKPHNHFICTSCRCIKDIHVDLHVNIPESISDDFEVTRTNVGIYGLCSKCKGTCTNKDAAYEGSHAS
jgi:Fur family peroxide stress response transcriptional regulator